MSKGTDPAIGSKGKAGPGKVLTIQRATAIVMDKESDPAHFRIAFRPVVSVKIDA